MPDELATLHQQIRETNNNITEIRQDIGGIKTSIAVLVEAAAHTEEHCPMRVDIARAGNGAVHAQARSEAAINLAQKAIDLTIENRIGIAKLAAMTVGGGISGGLIIEILRHLMLLQ